MVLDFKSGKKWDSKCSNVPYWQAITHTMWFCATFCAFRILTDSCKILFTDCVWCETCHVFFLLNTLETTVSTTASNALQSQIDCFYNKTDLLQCIHICVLCWCSIVKKCCWGEFALFHSLWWRFSYQTINITRHRYIFSLFLLGLLNFFGTWKSLQMRNLGYKMLQLFNF